LITTLTTSQNPLKKPCISPSIIFATYLNHVYKFGNFFQFWVNYGYQKSPNELAFSIQKNLYNFFLAIYSQGRKGWLGGGNLTH
jgi:hypothetical protein